MEIILNPAPECFSELCRRNVSDAEGVTEAVLSVIHEVVTDGDAALRRLAEKFDRATLTLLEVTEAEIAEACSKVSAEVKAAIATAADNISKFHSAQLPEPVEVETMPGVRCIQRPVAIDRVGLYIPGGRAPLFSTVLMLAIPARIAGCHEIVMCTPQGAGRPISPEILYAAKVAGVHHIYKVGGAQAIAAMAYGTDTIPRVHKIFGPGNQYVTRAKQLVSADVAIDMPAGPSEVMVMADATCDPRFVAADMLSQAEHGPDSQAMVVCDSMDLANAISAEVERQAASLPRLDSVSGSLSHSRIIVLDSTVGMISFANTYAPEHLIISMANPWDVAAQITAAGSVFIGNYSPESAGDYASGTNHTLPTSGWAVSMSGVNIDSFMHKITYQQLTPQGLAALAPVITSMARAEGLEAHARAAEIRLK